MKELNFKVFFFDGEDYTTGKLYLAQEAYSEGWISFGLDGIKTSDECSIICTKGEFEFDLNQIDCVATIDNLTEGQVLLDVYGDDIQIDVIDDYDDQLIICDDGDICYMTLDQYSDYYKLLFKKK